MKYPVTVRQAQKIVSRQIKENFYMPSESVAIAGAAGLDQVDRFYGHRDGPRILAQLARLAQRHGANHILLASPESPSAGEARPKGTDEVAPQSDDPGEGDLHGGDGASGEVEGSQSQGGDQSKAATAAAEQTGQAGSGSGSGGSGESGQGAASEGTSLPHPPKAGNTGDEPGQTGPETSQQATSGGTGNSSLGDANDLRVDGQPHSQSSPEKPDSTRAVPKTASNGKPGAGKMETEEALSMAKHDPANVAGSRAGSRTGTAKGSEGHGVQQEDASRPTAMVAESIELLPIESESPEEWGDASPSKPGDAEGTDTSENKVRYRSLKQKRGGGRAPSTAAKHKYGGITAKMSRAGITPTLIKQARQSLARLIDGGETQSGPRWDWPEFCKRLQTGRPLQPARKEEEGRPAILVLADVSGSCLGFSEESLLVAQAVARSGMVGADVVVVSHSNGYPQGWQVNQGTPQPIEGIPWGDPALPWYEKNLRRFNIQAVIALGDWDAEWLYHWLAELPMVRRLIWLDNWSASVIPPTLRRDLFQKASRNRQDVYFNSPWHFEQPWSRAARGKATYVVGCSVAKDFVKGISLALR